MFLDVLTGFPGSVHMSECYMQGHYRKCEANELFTRPEKMIEEILVRPLVLGDGAYPSATWLVKPYPSNIRLTNTQKKFNKSLSSAIVITEIGFGLLKGRWRCLLKRLDSDIEYVTNVILSCFVLHNITQIRGDKCIDYENLLNIIIREERNARLRRHQCPTGFQKNAELRDVLAQHVAGIFLKKTGWK